MMPCLELVELGLEVGGNRAIQVVERGKADAAVLERADRDATLEGRRPWPP